MLNLIWSYSQWFYFSILSNRDRYRNVNIALKFYWKILIVENHILGQIRKTLFATKITTTINIIFVFED